jgi:endonuclease YncB( thermonuclease family)
MNLFDDPGKLWLGVGLIVLFLAMARTLRRNRRRNVRGLRAEDGDSLVVRDENTQEVFRVRLAWIDAPEKGSPGAEEARDFLASLAKNKKLVLKPIQRDQYDRIVGRLSSEEYTDINLELLRSGHAWHYLRPYSKQPLFLRIRYQMAQLLARFGRKGLWARWGRTPPWETRKKARRFR